MPRIAVLPGDGIGPEVTQEAVRVLHALGPSLSGALEVEWHPLGGTALRETGSILPSSTFEAAQRADAVLVGAVGGPEWLHLPFPDRPEKSLLRLRKEFDLYANIRPARLIPSLRQRCPLRADITERGFDFVVLRELCGGVYYADPRGISDSGQGYREGLDSERYSEPEVERIIRTACRLARSRRGRVVSVDKQNVMYSSALWREVADRVATEFPDVTLEHMLADNMAMQLILGPDRYDVIVGSNLFGDLLSDEAGALCGSLGVLPSASVGDSSPFLYEPVHGTAPDIAGKGMANPVGAILSVGMMMTWSFGRPDLDQAVWDAVSKVLNRVRTPDLWEPGTEKVSTAEMGSAVLEALLLNNGGALK